MTSNLPSITEKREFVRSLFDRIAPMYDRMNRLMTLGLDQRWRKSALEHARLQQGECLLDLATGTGDLAGLAQTQGASVVAVDLAPQMLQVASRRLSEISFLVADGASLPFEDASFDLLSCGFALRNFVDPKTIFAECARVLRPDGRMLLLEVDSPKNALLATMHGVYFQKVVPWLGRIFADADAYRYLPQSVVYLPDEQELFQSLESVGFGRIQKRNYLFGAVQELIAWKA